MPWFWCEDAQLWSTIHEFLRVHTTEYRLHNILTVTICAYPTDREWTHRTDERCKCILSSCRESGTRICMPLVRLHVVAQHSTIQFLRCSLLFESAHLRSVSASCVSRWVRHYDCGNVCLLLGIGNRRAIAVHRFSVPFWATHAQLNFDLLDMRCVAQPKISDKLQFKRVKRSTLQHNVNAYAKRDINRFICWKAAQGSPLSSQTHSCAVPFVTQSLTLRQGIVLLSMCDRERTVLNTQSQKYSINTYWRWHK